jgi:hypothetical protein
MYLKGWEEIFSMEKEFCRSPCRLMHLEMILTYQDSAIHTDMHQYFCKKPQNNQTQFNGSRKLCLSAYRPLSFT